MNTNKDFREYVVLLRNKKAQKWKEIPLYAKSKANAIMIVGRVFEAYIETDVYGEISNTVPCEWEVVKIKWLGYGKRLKKSEKN